VPLCRHRLAAGKWHQEAQSGSQAIKSCGVVSLMRLRPVGSVESALLRVSLMDCRVAGFNRVTIISLFDEDWHQGFHWIQSAHQNVAISLRGYTIARDKLMACILLKYLNCETMPAIMKLVYDV